MRRAVFVLLACAVLAPTAVRGDFSFVPDSSWRGSVGAVRSLTFSPDGSRLVIGGEEGSVVTALGGGALRPLGELQGLRGEARGVAVSPDGDTIALVDDEGYLYLYDVRGGSPRLTASVDAHKKGALAVGFTMDGEYVVTGGGDQRVRIWTHGGASFGEMPRQAGHRKAVTFVAGVSPGHVLTVGEDQQIILWNVATRQAVRSAAVEMEVRSASVGGGGGVLALGLQQRFGNLHRSSTANAHEIKTVDKVRLIDAANGMQVAELDGEAQDLDAVGVTPDGRFVATGGSGARALIWDKERRTVITRIPFSEAATSLAFAPDGKWMAVGTEAGGVSLFRLTGVGPPIPPGPGGQILIILIEPQNARAAMPQVASPSLRVRGRIKGSAPLKSLVVGGQEITAIVPAEGGDLLFTAYVPLPAPGRNEVEIVAEDQSGSRTRESFIVERARQVAPAKPGTGRRLALIVGVSRYRYSEINLQYADDDARALYQFLTSKALGPAAFKPDDVLLLLDDQATAARINTGLREFLQQARENDFVLFFFAGHGAPDPNRLQDLYLVAHDTDPKNIAGTGLLMRHVREDIAQIGARDVLVLTDACHSAGMGAPQMFRRALETNGIHQTFLDRMLHSSGGLAILTASEAAQASLETKERGHGVFTDYLLRGLRGEADADHDGIVELGEIMEFVRDNVKASTSGQQIPAIGPTSFDREMPLVVVTSP